ncbi:MAG: aldehyde dehydrogenase family protein [Planctomycetota bacterium]
MSIAPAKTNHEARGRRRGISRDSPVHLATAASERSAALFGGCNHSGVGREEGAAGLDNYLETKTVTVAM